MHDHDFDTEIHVDCCAIDNPVAGSPDLPFDGVEGARLVRMRDEARLQPVEHRLARIFAKRQADADIRPLHQLARRGEEVRHHGFEPGRGRRECRREEIRDALAHLLGDDQGLHVIGALFLIGSPDTRTPRRSARNRPR